MSRNATPRCVADRIWDLVVYVLSRALRSEPEARVRHRNYGDGNESYLAVLARAPNKSRSQSRRRGLFRVRQHAVNELVDDGAVSFDFKVFHFVVIEVLVELFR